MELKKWREIAVPRDDVCKGNFQEAEFAADISSVRQNRATKEYQDPELFFSMTYITSGMEALLKNVLKRITGTGGDPVIQLQTAFGGGKTHSLLAVYHIAKQEKPLSSLKGIGAILNNLNIVDLPKSKVVVIDGTNQDASNPRIYGDVHINTLWGDIAWQLGGEEALEEVKKNDIDGTAPTKDTFIQLLTKYGPVVILMDELVRYIAQFKEGKEYNGGTYNSNLSFIQNLTEAVKQVPNAILLASLPESEHEAGDAHGLETLRALEHYFGRIQAIWRPIETQESFEIVRRRLFKQITDDNGRREVCKAFAEQYTQNANDFPPETQESAYYEKLIQAYPIHPELFERLYNDWSSLPNFQRTRGVLKLMAKVIHNLWINGNSDLMIMPGALPLNSEVKSDFISYLPVGWDPVVDGDVDGTRSEASKIDAKNERFGKLLACRKVARTIFLGTAPGSRNKQKRGIDRKDVLLGVVEPNQLPATYSDVLDHMRSKFYFLNYSDDDYWFDIRPTLRKVMEDRKNLYNKDESINGETRKILVELLKPKDFINYVHVFTPDSDIPDDKSLRLVVLPPGENYNKNSSLSSFSTATKKANSMLENHGEQSRKYRNRLIFLAADTNCVDRFKEQIVSMLAWDSIVKDYSKNILILDNLQAKNAEDNLAQSKKTAKQTIRECYKHLLIPEIIAEDGNTPPSKPEWKELSINPNSPDPMREIQKILKDEEYMIPEWAPNHLTKELKKWYWDKKDFISLEDFWDDSCKYIYLPRLSDIDVLHTAIENGTKSKEYFGIAYGFEDGKYIDFRFGDADKNYIKSGSTLIINPAKAEEYSKTLIQNEPPSQGNTGGQGSSNGNINTGGNTQNAERTDTGAVSTQSDITKYKRFHGSVSLSPNSAVNDLADINEYVIRILTNSGADVEIGVEIHAKIKDGFDSKTVRTVNENIRTINENNKNNRYCKFNMDNTQFDVE